MPSLATAIERLPPSKRLALLAGFFILAGLLLYGRSISYEFVELDDALLIYENPKVQGLTLGNLRKIFTTFDPELYIPVTLLSFQADYALGGTAPFVYHLHNILLHALNAMLVTVLAWQLLRRSVPAVPQFPRLPHFLLFPSIFTGLLFLVHPLGSEAVVWASARKDVLSTFFALLSAVAYIHAARATPDNPARARISSIVSIVAFGLGLMAKVAIVPLPLAFLLFDWLDNARENTKTPSRSVAVNINAGEPPPRRPLIARSLANKLPYFLLAVSFGIVAVLGKSHVARPPTYELFLMWTKSVTFFLGKLIWPSGLSILYPYEGPITLAESAFWAPLLVLVSLLAIIAVAALRGYRPIAAGLAFFLLMLAPSIFNLAKLPDYYITSDRYAYVPMIGLFLLAGAGLAWALERAMKENRDAAREPQASLPFFPYLPSLPFFAVIVILLALSVTTFLHIPIWRDHEALAWHVLSLYPRSRIALMDLGNALRDRGAFSDAREAYDASLAIREDPHVLYNKALLLEFEGKPGEATSLYERAVALAPFYEIARINLGKLYYQQGRISEARAQFETVARAAPHLAMPHFNLGVIAAAGGNATEAERFYRAAITADPRFADARVNLIVLLLDAGRTDDAVAELRAALTAIPADPRFDRMRAALVERGVMR